MYLLGMKYDVRVEQNNSNGRSDIIVNFEHRRVVIELKYSKDGRDTDALLQDAVNQIKDKEYGREIIGLRELLQIACVFNGAKESRQITAYHSI